MAKKINIELEEAEAKRLLKLLETIKDKIIFKRVGDKTSDIIKDVKSAYSSLINYSNIAKVLNDTLRGPEVQIIESKKGFATVIDSYTGKILGYEKDYETAAKKYGKKIPSIKKIK